MKERREFPLSVYALIATLGATAVLTAVVSDQSSFAAPSWVIFPMAATLLIAGLVQVEFSWGGHRYSLDLFEAALVPLVAVFGGPGAVVVSAVTKLASQRALRVQGTKATFNTVTWATAAGSASLVYDELRGPERIDFAALAASVAIAVMITHVAVAFAIALAKRGGIREVVRVLAPTLMPGSLASAGANISLGVLFAAVAASHPELSALFGVPLLLCGWAQKAYGEVIVDRTRVQALQHATHELAVSADIGSTLPAALDAVREAFTSAAVVLIDRDSHVLAASGDAAAVPVALAFANPTIGNLSGRATSEDATPEGAVLRAAARRNAIFASLVIEDRAVGTLVSIDRGGIDGFDAGELAVFEALAAEIAGAMERAELQATLVRERAHLIDVIDGSSDGIFTVTADGVIHDWNPAMGDITGFPPVEAKGSRAVAILRPRTVDGVEIPLEQWRASGIESLPEEIVVLTRTGTPRRLACSFSETPESEDSLIVVARDVTRQRELDQLRDDFVATVSHELRTPLTSIVGFTSMLIDPPRPLTEHEQGEALSMIRRGARRLERLVFNLLEVARIENRAQPAPKPVDINEACENAVAELKETWPHREIRVGRVYGAVRAIGNQLSIEQILTNLIGNALKYSDRGPIEVAVEENPDSLVVTVTDHGPGIAEGDLERIFDRFHRIDHDHVQAGTGLGLYISRQLATAMDGTLEVTSTPGKGSTFALTLPAQLHLVAVS